MGPGVGPVPCFPGPRHRAPDWTQLLPQQDISGGNATAQDIFTDFLRSCQEGLVLFSYWALLHKYEGKTF